VLEALIVLAKGRSFRTGQVISLLGPAQDQFLISATIENSQGRSLNLGIERSASHWRARREGQDVRQLSDLAEDLPLVLMEPNSHQLISGPPEGRRRYLDWGVFHVEHAFLPTWRRYSRAIKQRNAALRSRDPQLVRSLDPLVEDLGEQIHQLRALQIEKLQAGLGQQLAALGPALPEIGVRYQKGWTGDSLRAALELSVERDMDRGMTGPGPHRADLVFHAGAKPARDTLSRGEQKLLAAALLLAQAQSIAAAGTTPVLMMDDLASEFDATHRSSVLNAGLASGAQLWVTGTELETIPGSAAGEGRVFHVEQGRVMPAADA
jgi:DNA replication and repair protein RecF